MKIGILTFHSQQNYGGVLQCWALKTAIERLGHEVVVVDRWLSASNGALRREFVWLDIKGWIKLFIRSFAGCGDFGCLLRTIRSIRFVNRLGLTGYHFCEWKDVPKDLGVDCLIIGSDQVWHCGDWGNPAPYLLEGAPEIKAISYAASFGLSKLPCEVTDLYRRGLARFLAISCREREGVEICKSLGYSATHVVDPTLLINSEEWRKLTGKVEKRNKLACYFMAIELKDALPMLKDFADKTGNEVVVLANNGWSNPFPKSIGQLSGNYDCGRVKIYRSAGPKEFVKEFASAKWTLTDSFHAVMFSTIFNCNLRFVRPGNLMRQTMFARIEEFAEKCIRGNVFVNTLEEALKSFAGEEEILYNSGAIEEMRSKSQKWLKSALNWETS